VRGFLALARTMARTRRRARHDVKTHGTCGSFVLHVACRRRRLLVALRASGDRARSSRSKAGDAPTRPRARTLGCALELTRRLPRFIQRHFCCWRKMHERIINGFYERLRVHARLSGPKRHHVSTPTPNAKMGRVRKEITASLLASFGSDARGTR